ncbi:hypothetical protein ACR9GP_24375 [Enterobacter ludwigii]
MVKVRVGTERTSILTRKYQLHISRESFTLPLPTTKQFIQQIMLVDMRITLPWFIELNTSARGTGSKFSFLSHRLRFALKRTT